MLLRSIGRQAMLPLLPSNRIAKCPALGCRYVLAPDGLKLIEDLTEEEQARYKMM